MDERSMRQIICKQFGYSIGMFTKLQNLLGIMVSEILEDDEIQLDENQEEIELTRCCGAEFYEDTDICSECKEHG